jgi:hypothetical protein
MKNKKTKPKTGLVGYVENKNLGIPISGGHYVYIRSVKDGKCEVNVITSLENKQFDFDKNKISKIKYGYVYALPRGETNFTLWSGVKNEIKTIDPAKIKSVGNRYICPRHQKIIEKYFENKKSPP